MLVFLFGMRMPRYINFMKLAGQGVQAIEALAPAAIKDGAVDRSVLRQAILDDKGLLKKIEASVHPLVLADRQKFLEKHSNEPLVVCDIPLLLETGADKWLGAVLVVTADAEIQRKRVMEREGMTQKMFETIKSKQLPDAEKRQRADYLIDTGLGLDHARAEVLSLIERIKGK